VSLARWSVRTSRRLPCNYLLPLPLAVEVRQQGALGLMHLIAAIGQHQQEPVRRRLTGEKVEELQRALIAPMEIFKHQQERSGSRGLQEDIRSATKRRRCSCSGSRGGRRERPASSGKRWTCSGSKGTSACAEDPKAVAIWKGERGARNVPTRSIKRAYGQARSVGKH
jgi:hypothetical protein